MSYRIKPQDITSSGISPFMTRYAARCAVPLADAIDSAELFLAVRSNLRAGDQVVICRYEHGDWNKARVVEYVEVMITQVTSKDVEFEPMTEVRIVGQAKPEPVVEETLPELEVVPEEKGGFLARDVATGHVHKHFKTKAAAERYVRDYGGPAKAA